MIHFLLKRISHIVNNITVMIVFFIMLASIVLKPLISKDTMTICLALMCPVMLLNIVVFIASGFKITFDEKEIRYLWFGLVYKRTTYDKISAISIRHAKNWKGYTLRGEDGRCCVLISLYSSDVSFLVNRQDDIGDAIINSGESDCILKIPFNDECLQQLIDKTDARIYLSNGIIKQNKPELLYFLDVHYNRFYKRESGFSKLINQRKTG